MSLIKPSNYQMAHKVMQLLIISYIGDCIVAMNKNKDSFNVKHNAGNVRIEINFLSGLGIETEEADLKTTHGILMLLGWGVFTVIGMLVAR